ncbi:MAG: ATP-dependent Clp protease adaptor ClpS [Proteobacteria bacterium]|nr:ATP-dependent Clp protease adaptor ClpS [Pseudomonadota bacterium]
MSRKTRSKESVNTGLKERVKRPPKYNVLLHNDDYTPFAFVIIVLLQIFYKTQAQALVITQNAHNEGKAVIGSYPKEIAEMKCLQAISISREQGFPLTLTVEPE